MTSHVFKPPKLRRYHILESISSKTFIPPEYQVELLNSARHRNTIICLGTGTGKTFVAVMLIKEFSHQLRENPLAEIKRTVFLALTAPLVIQHAKVIIDCTDLTVGQYFGSKVQNWTKEYWLGESEKNQVFVMSPDVFKTILDQSIFPLSMFNLIVFDECQSQRYSKNQSYKDIIQNVEKLKLDSQPRILGLSASLVNNRCYPLHINQQIQQLESVLKSNVETASDLTSLSKYGSKPKECIAIFNPYFEKHPAVWQVVNLITEALFFLDSISICDKQSDSYSCKQPQRYLIEFSYVLMNLGLWCSFKVINLFIEEIDNVLESLCASEQINFLVLVRTTLLCIRIHVKNMLNENNLVTNLIEKIPSKLKRLLSLLEPYKPEEKKSSETVVLKKENTKPTNSVEIGQRTSRNDNRSRRQRTNNVPDDGKSLCGLVFVRQRVTAFLLSEWLTAVKENVQNLSFVSPGYIIGRGKNLKNMTMGFQRQDDVLQKFRTKVCNLVFATSVVEEGMDIPKCNLVIRFDPPENFRVYVQSKSRARVNDSMYVMLVKISDKEKYEHILSNYKAVEEMLLMKCHEADGDMDELLDENVDELIDAYMPAKKDGSARVTLSTSIALVNRYCAKLPSDTFTRLIPKWKIVEDDTRDVPFQCILKLPINSPLKKTVTGQWMKSKQLAKMATALQTCIELHKAGELDDNLLPTGKENVKSEDFMLEDHVTWKKGEEDSNVLARPGSTKRRMYYFKRVACALQNSLPVASEPCYLHVFDMKLTCPIPDDQNTRGRKIHDPSDTIRGFGILTRKKIPPICSFPVFTRSGEVTIGLKTSCVKIMMQEENLEPLAFFHQYTFSDVLRLEKYPMSHKPTDAEAAFFIVPVTANDSGDFVVDWKFIDLIYQERLEKYEKLTDDKRKNFNFVLNNYQDAVVMPWYRNLDKPQFFYVAEICSNLSPLSDFPDQEYKSFKEYYKKKYNITIMNENQPLLDVDHTSARLNLLTPRYVNRKGVTLPTSSEQTKRTKRENLQQKQILIPELCMVHPYPAYLWRKAVCLPCILYRLNSLLLAEQLRLQVAKSISIGIRELPINFEWPPLDFGWTLADIITSHSEDKECDQTQTSNIEKETYKMMDKRVCENLKVISEQDFPFESRFSKQLNTDITSCNEIENTCNSALDFEIDVFDPSKVYIPDDDALMAQELNEMNFGLGEISFGEGFSKPINSFPIWQPIPNGISNHESDSNVRCGSPSFFEDSGWDSEWDTDASFLSVNVQGLGYISAPGINMESLSMDLANCKDDETWDSLDEDSDSSDIEDSISNVTESNQPQQQKNKTCEDSCENSWLTCTVYKETTDFIFNEEKNDINLLVDDFVYNLKENKKKELEYISLKENSEEHLPKHFAFDKLFQIVTESEKKVEPECLLTSCDAELETNNLMFSDKFAHGILNCENSLAFGELLPNRENHQIYNNVDRVSFDDNTNIEEHPGPSPSIILQALTMSNANDGINLERLETVGDSFLKYAITVYLFCMYPNIHEGKLSYLRSKQISNFNLFKLGRKKGLGELMVATKFEPYDNWLPPNYIVPKGLEEALIESGIPAGAWNLGKWNNLTQMSEEEIRELIIQATQEFPENSVTASSSLVPYNLLTQQSIPDKSIADCVEALIGAYLVSCGSRGALLFMSWLGLHVLPTSKKPDGSFTYGFLDPPHQPMLAREPKSDLKLQKLLAGYSAFEKKIDYCFNDKTCLLQAFTHASYYYNELTDCYQRLEFLGDAVLDYLITRHLYEDPKKHSPGTLTDLRSALVNNTFFASLAVKYDFHKFFKAISPGLFNVINKFVQLKERNTRIDDFLQAYYLEEDECEEMEDVEIPKALGDIFESVAGAIYLDSNMSLDTVWRVYYSMMKPEIEYFSNHVPKSPIRELLELEPQTAKFERAEMTVSGKVRVCVDVFGKGQFMGVGRNKRIAKCTAAKHALRELKKNKL